MKKTTSALVKIAYFIAALMLGWLAYNTAHYTFTHDFDDLSSAFLYECPDSRVKNLLVLILAFVALFVLAKIFFIKADTHQKKNKRVLILSFVLSALFFVLACIWVSKTYIAPFWDQAYIIEAAGEFMNGNFTKMSEIYLKMYPQQLGLIFFESLFLRIWNFYGIFQYMNAFFVAVIIVVMGRLSHEIFDNPTTDFYVTLFTAFCAPLFYYVSYIYGDVFSLMSCLIICFLFIKWVKTKKVVYCFISIATAIIMVPIRENSLIFILALIIATLIFAIRDKKPVMMVFAVLMLVLPLLSTKGIKLYYEAKSGVTLDNEIPSINWVVMGMQGTLEEGTGVGYYNGYNYYSWNMNDMNKEKATAYSKEVMADFFEQYKADPVYAYKFYRYKIFEQWLEPTFDCVYMTVSEESQATEKTEFLYSKDRVVSLNSYMNYYLTIIYVFAFVSVIFAFFKDTDYYGLILYVFFIGQFLFSIIWEAKGRYTLPGFVFLLLIATCGLAKTTDLANKSFTKIRSLSNGKSDKELNSNS